MRFAPFKMSQLKELIIQSPFFASTSVYNLFIEVIKVSAPCKFSVLNRIVD